jgi:Domain of unknown function (DUF4145)
VARREVWEFTLHELPCDFGCPCACVRRANESVLDRWSVKRYTKNKKPLSLHNRLELFEKKNSKVPKHLMALKWLGNVGAHEDEVENEVVLDAFALLDYVFEELYLERTKTMDKIASSIVRTKGRSARKKR